MRAVWKYEVPVVDEWYSITMPLDSMILHVDRSPFPDAVWMWVEVDLDEKEVAEAQFRIFGTGHEIPDDAAYWGTVHLLEYRLVWHLYERRVDG